MMCPGSDVLHSSLTHKNWNWAVTLLIAAWKHVLHDILQNNCWFWRVTDRPRHRNAWWCVAISFAILTSDVMVWCSYCCRSTVIVVVCFWFGDQAINGILCQNCSMWPTVLGSRKRCTQKPRRSKCNSERALQALLLWLNSRLILKMLIRYSDQYSY